MKKDILKEEWSARVKACAECIVKNDFKLASKLMAEAADDVECMAIEHEYYSNPITNFGKLNHMVSESIVELKANYPEFLKEWSQLIKEDANLRGQYMFYMGLSKVTKDFATGDVITEAVKMCDGIVNKDTLEESNLKAFKLLEKHELIINDMLTESESKYYDSCQFMLLNNKTNMTLVEHAKAISEVRGYLESAEGDSIFESLEKKDKSIGALTQSEMKIVDAINGDEDKQNVVFDELKSECLKKIDDNCNSEDCDKEKAERLSKVREAVDKMSYTKETFTEQIKKMLDFLTI